MTHKVGIVGATGYTGVELLRLLAGHPELEVVVATADSNAGKRIPGVYPSLAAAYPTLETIALDPAMLAGLDVVFLALPHGASQALAGTLIDTVGHVVDLGADFRLPADVYAQWYGEEHSAPTLFDQFAYGLPELFRADILGAKHVAAPGCYPTAVSLGCAPLVGNGVIDGPIIANAVSGVSGAGRGLKTTSLFAEVDENVNAYGLLTHRHTAEMERNLTRVADRAVSVLFTPHLVPMTRGIHATCAAPLAARGETTESLLAQYREFYADEPNVVVLDEPPHTKATMGSNAVHVSVRVDQRTGTVLALSTLDNLTKGASGQALQCANLLLGLPEQLGLTTVGVVP